MIDAGTGNIHLPNDFVITAFLTQEEFQQSWFRQSAHANRPPSMPGYCWFLLDAGTLNGFQLSVQLSFSHQLLMHVCLSCAARIVDDQPETWLPAEIEVKGLHDALLLSDLGMPDMFTDTSSNEPGLDKAPNYSLSWGKVSSEYDYGGGDAYIFIEYNGKKEQTRDEEPEAKGRAASA